MTADGREYAINPPVQHVTILDHITALLGARDRHYDQVRQSIDVRMEARDRHYDTLLAEVDLRHQQRFDAQTKALEAALQAAKEAVNTAMVAAEKATSKAETATEKRFEGVNEFRAQLNDQAATFMPRSEAEQRIAALAEKLDIMQTLLTTSVGRSQGLSAGWGYLLGAVGLIGAVVAVLVGN